MIIKREIGRKFGIELEIEGQEKPGFVAENLAMIFV